MKVKLHDKLPVTFSTKHIVKKVAKKGDCNAFLEHYLGNIVMRVLAQLGKLYLLNFFIILNKIYYILLLIIIKIIIFIFILNFYFKFYL